MNTSRSRMPVIAMCGIALAAGVITFRAQADEWNKKTILTIDQPIQVTDTYLEPGTYVMKLANSSSDRHIVQIYNRDENHLIDTVMAMPNYRLQPTGNSRFMFWETPAGSARALRAWFYPGDNFGQEFRYPKHLRQIAQATVTTVTPPPAPAPEPPVTRAPEPVPPPVAEQTPREEPPVIAQNSPPEAAPAPAPPPPAEQPKELPKTASPYPLVGLSGLLALGLYALLRVKNLA